VRYALLICNSEEAPAPDARVDAALADGLASRGVLRDGARFDTTAQGAIVRVREGAVEVGDGPFAEMLVASPSPRGYWARLRVMGCVIVECDGIDEAVRVAALLPEARTGRVEVRALLG
jgi:hypothetical protein